jgi:hypothetical protein
MPVETAIEHDEIDIANREVVPHAKCCLATTVTYVDSDLDDLSNWIVLALANIESEAGAKFEQQSDGSFLVSGPIQQHDVYSSTADLDPTGVTAVRLDVLKDKRLPGNGPGRHATGSFHLAEI